MQISVALSLTLVFLATVFAGPKPKTYLVETADPEPEHYVSIWFILKEVGTGTIFK